MGRNPAKREEVLRFLLPFACQAQRVEGVEAGRRYIAAIPRLWLLENVERVAEELLDLSDEWEHERLVDLYEHLEAPDHKARLLVRGLVRGD